MSKNTYYVIEEQEKETGKTIAFVRKIPNCYNLKDIFQPSRGCVILSINACDTKKAAENIATFWNICARENGNYMFQDAPFQQA